MASWQFILVGVLATVVLSSAKDCEYEGQKFADGSKFKLPMSGNCIEYTCKNGGYGVTKKECQLGSECFAIGYESNKNCRRKVCREADDGKIGFKNTEIKCEGDGGECFNPGDEFTKTFEDTKKVYKKTTCTIEGEDINYAYRN